MCDLILSVTYLTQYTDCLRRVGIDVKNSEIGILYMMRRAKILKRRNNQRGERVEVRERSRQKGNKRVLVSLR